MHKHKILSGKDIVSIFKLFGFIIVAQKGSHMKLRRVLSSGEKQTLTIPYHAELDTGTVHAIYRQASHYIPEYELKKYFYNE